ncbi:hypothetical protein NDK47_27570 (plasmid) [Brevibacillus ruminantium]|uniref:Uncharacterized protein n=1 Tax=Brevibacillus ruminantium TaxID=2950604 RepID=A0ABY4WN38_9BACL|nr:hypothetical protein [Brevibacillus ruminantium]USG68562.1 hypothetical protein NDK47_27570 [Brevibacillus ruminantium]
MPRVAISGYIVGFRLRENAKQERYGVVDLLQFGSQQADSEIVPLLVYDRDMQVHIHQRFLVGQIRPASFFCNIVTREKSGWMWIADRLVELGRNVSQEEDLSTSVVVNGTGPHVMGEDKELTTGNLAE